MARPSDGDGDAMARLRTYVRTVSLLSRPPFVSAPCFTQQPEG
jgi:hypothetical protein